MADAEQAEHERHADAGAILAGRAVHEDRPVGVGDLVNEVDQHVGGVLEQDGIERHERLGTLVAGPQRVEQREVDQSRLEMIERVPVPELERRAEVDDDRRRPGEIVRDDVVAWGSALRSRMPGCTRRPSAVTRPATSRRLGRSTGTRQS